jgi:Mrp family chromosome partitioning ATPase/capsular polysaccharide biosynthesis protein
MLKKFLKKIKKKKLFFVIPFVLGVSFVFAYVSIRQPLYQTKATVKAENSFDLLPTSNEILSAALANLGVLDYSHPDISIAMTKERISINKDLSSGIVEIIIRGSNPEELSRLTREITNTYVAKINAKAEEWNKMASEKKEHQMQAYKKNLKEQLVKAKEQLEKYEQQIEELKKQEEGVGGRASELKGKLAELERVRAELLRVYTSAYPEVMRVDAEIALIKEKLNVLPKEPEGKLKLEREFKENQKIYNALKEKWDEVDLKKIEEFKEARNAAVIINYTERPLLITDIIRRRTVILLGSLSACLIGLIVLTIAVILDTTFATAEELFAFTHIYVAGSIPYIKAPKGVKNKNKAGLLLGCENEEEIIEPYKLVYMHIQANVFNEQEGAKSIFLTSAAPKEGKSIVAANLALAIARAGKKVLIIDANFIAPVMHTLFGIRSPQPGFTDLLNKGVGFEAAARDVTDFLLGGIELETALKFRGLDKLKVLTAGSPVADAAELLRSGKMHELMVNLKSSFNYIILDGPAVLSSADSVIIANECDAALLVYLAQKTTRSSLKSALARLNSAKSQAGGRLGLKAIVIKQCI